jgi:hypothetical protein
MKARLLSIFFCLVILRVWAQNTPTLHGETMQLHLNGSFFLTGETLHFSIFCFDQQSGRLSSLSTIAYIEIIGADGKPLTQMKVRLADGAGSGDYFFDSNVPTENYTIIGYTKWMRNFDQKDFFRANLTVINPLLRPETIREGSSDSSYERAPVSRTNESLKARFDKTEVGLREKVTLNVDNMDSITFTLSASVRAVDPELAAIDPWSGEPNGASEDRKEIQFVPDFRGEILTGVVTGKTDGTPLSGKIVTLSSPSKSFDFLSSTTDSSGRYYFRTSDIGSDFFLLAIQDISSTDVSIRHDNEFLDDHSAFVPKKFELDKSLMKLIARRNLSLQVENAFYAVKKDSLLAGKTKSRFFGTPDRVYKLDDFTAFPTMEDVFREIIPEVVVKLRDANFSFMVKSSSTSYRLENPPLALIDGIPVADANIVMKYDPSLIQTISLLLDRYYYGGLQVDGIISIETRDGDARSLTTDNFVRLDYIPVQPSRIYYSPVYESGADLTRIPDYRTQLYWSPTIKLNSNSTQKLSFYTGDLPGTYAIEVVGVSSQGQKIYWRRLFEVREK